MFDRSQILVLGREEGSERPWYWSTEPVYGNGPMQPPTVAGVKTVPSGVFISLTDGFVEMLKEGLTDAQKATLDSWVFKVSSEVPYQQAPTNGFYSAAFYHIPIWAGQTTCTLFRIPAGTWNDPKTTPPLNVRQRMKHLWRAAN